MRKLGPDPTLWSNIALDVCLLPDLILIHIVLWMLFRALLTKAQSQVFVDYEFQL